MAIVKKGGSDPYRGKVMTSMGYRAPRPPLCMNCGQRKEDQLYTINANGQEICADCANEADRIVLTMCGDDRCACGAVDADETYAG